MSSAAEQDDVLMLPRRTIRARYTFTVPESMGGDVRTVTMIALKASEELQATKRAHGDVNLIGYEMARGAIFAINGQGVSLADGSVDKAFETMDPRVRSLVLQGFARIHSPEDEQASGFFQSLRTEA